MVIRYVVALLVACALFHPVNAQPTLLFKRVEVMYPKIRLAFKVTCGENFRNDIQPEHYEVFENGLKVKDATLWCPPVVDCCVSVALVFDRSGSMQEEERMENVIKSGKIFVNSMHPDGIPCDEATIVSFADDVTLDVGMTTNKLQLLQAIDALEPFGWTALWDAVATGIQELSTSATNRCQAVIVLTDGGDNRSNYFRTVEAVTQYALSQNVKVYTVAYGIPGGSGPDNALRYLAAATGGEHYLTASGEDIAGIYARIRESIKESFKECYIEYESDCPDGTQRVVELRINDFCDGYATQSRTYIAPLDRSQFLPVDISIADGEVASTREIVIPVMLETPVTAVFSKSAFSVGYDRNVLQLLRVTTDGTLLEGQPIDVRIFGSGAAVEILDHVELNTGGGVLCYLHFRAGDVANITHRYIEMLSWVFEAYCLTPRLRHGRLTILPREPELVCQIEAPDALNWNDEEKRYEPNPFTVTVRVINTGTKEAWNPVATLVTDPSVVELVTPTVNTQAVAPNVIFPGREGTAQWTLLATKQEDLDSIPLYFNVRADNHPEIACWERLVVDPALSSALVCEISAPDTVFFREQYYEPQEFDIHVTAHNVGSGQTRDVRAQLLQDTRFTIIPPASKDLADVLPPGERTESHFRVRMNARDTDGYDTVRVNIQGDDTSPAWCSYPIWVQRVRMPEFTLNCSTPIDSLVFNEASYGYEPNPFTVTTVATNIGETYAEDCQLMFVGPERFTPIGNNLRPIGTMQVGDTRTAEWDIRALPRTIAAWDTLEFQVLGRGGMGKQIVIAECRLPVFVPALRGPEYDLVCSVPDSMQYVDNRYQPDPLPFTLRITNIGSAEGRDLSPALILPPSVSLVEGETAQRSIPTLAAGETVNLTWLLRPEMRAYDGDYRICAQVVDAAGGSGQCCSDVFIPKTENPILMTSCWSIDTLYQDSESGEYLGNPFEVILNLTNIGLGTATNARASISVLGSFIEILDPTEQMLGDLPSGDARRLTWRVRALKRDLPSDIPIVMTVSADNHPAADCALTVHIPALRRPVLMADCHSFPEDSLLFDWETGQFEYPVCTLTLKVTNVGAVNAQNVTALLVLPSGVVLAPGEETLKPVSPSVLEPGAEGSVTWNISAMRADEDMLREFRFVARADNAGEAECTDDLFVQGSPRHVTLSFPEYTLLRFGERQKVPIYIDRTIGKDLSEYRLELVYDPTVINIIGASNNGTLTGYGWVGAKLYDLESGRLEISDYTTGSALAKPDGVLVTLTIEGVFNQNSDYADFGETTLRIDTVASLLNRGGISLTTVDGRVYATNQCLEPLVATEQYELRQNRPNPFNPSTVIEFILPNDDYVRLTVFDRHGREVALLADGEYPKGSHLVRFSGERLPSGIYFYRFESSNHFEVRKMTLTR
jgi:hypothetical protein